MLILWLEFFGIKAGRCRDVWKDNELLTRKLEAAAFNKADAERRYVEQRSARIKAETKYRDACGRIIELEEEVKKLG